MNDNNYPSYLQNLLNAYMANYGTVKDHYQNTVLSLTDEMKYQDWVKQKLGPMANDAMNPRNDYDYRGLFMNPVENNLLSKPSSNNQYDNLPHFVDTYKKTIHPSFSQYSENLPKAPYRAGMWSDDGFYTSPKGHINTDIGFNGLGLN